MKKIYLLGAFLGALAFYACKKEEKTVTVTNTVNDTVWLNDLVNPDTLTAGITVGYGTSVASATFPTASANGPVLDTFYNNTYQVVEGSYLIIYPPNVSGYVAGYYVQIAGAKSSFKISYKEADAQRKAARRAQTTNGAKNYGDATGFIDAAIVIKMPAEITGDTFYVKYAAFDSLDRVSTPVTATVVVMPQGDATFNNALAGTWLYTSTMEYGNGSSTDAAFVVDTLVSDENQYFTCNNGTLTTSSSVTDIYLSTSYYRYALTYTFDKYSYNLHFDRNSLTLNVGNSTCSNYVYDVNTHWVTDYNGYTSYDAATHKLTLIRNTYTSNISFDYDTYTVVELTDHTLVLGYQTTGDNDSQTTSLSKYVK